MLQKGTDTPPKSLPNNKVIEEDEEDIEVILDGPVEDDPFFSPEGGGQSHGDGSDSEHSSNDDGYSSWHGVDSSMSLYYTLTTFVEEMLG